MIVLDNLTKVFTLNGRRKVVANGINAVFPSRVSVGLLGRNGAGKSTLLKMIAGTTHPTSGRVLSDGTISFPVGLANSLHGDLTGAQNTRFVARIYGADTDALMDYVEDFADLGDHFHLPVRSYSSGMRGRLSFGINMGLEFDTYLIDEVTAVGDAAFKRKSRDVFLARMKNSGAVFVSHSMGSIREMCKAGAVIEDGQLHYYEDVEEAIDRYMHSLEGTLAAMTAPRPEGAAETDFPGDARMLFGIGAPQTRIEWLSDCLRRHRPCHFPKQREPHYFDARAGLAPDLVGRRLATPGQLAGRLQEAEDGETRRNIARLLREISDTVAMHAAPAEGPDRHNAYVDLLKMDRKTQPVICDFTPGYARLDTPDFTEMSTIGNARFVMVLRDPAQRLWAQVCESLPPRRRTAEACAAAAWQLTREPGLLSSYPEADYLRTMAALEAAVSRERILYLFHEELDGTRESLAELCAFLEIPKVPDLVLPPLPQDTLPAQPEILAAPLRHLLAAQYEGLAARFGARLPAAWKTAPAQADSA